MTVVLASQSPRRRELLGQMGFTDFVIRPAKGEEVVDPGLLPDKLVEELSRQKCEEVAAASGADDLIIAADTVRGVALEDAVHHASAFIAKVLRRALELDLPRTDGLCFEEFLTEIDNV